MQCPRCSSQTIRVLESRSAESGQSVRRRRECSDCKYRFTTYERIEFVPIMVTKRDGSRESFDRRKILQGIMRACEKSQVSVPEMERLSENIEERLQLEDVQEVTTARIGEMVLDGLQPLSEVAYVRFASVYRKFQGVRDFVRELSHLVDDTQPDSEPIADPLSSSTRDSAAREVIDAGELVGLN
ncbi:MAG: transcriptional regulator NrdR [Cyanobacteria bacterium J06648_11]